MRLRLVCLSLCSRSAGSFSYNYFTSVYTAIQDVIEPRLRGTAVALFFACLYLLGGGMGPVVVGLLSDQFAEAARVAAGAAEMNELFKAQGLHDAMISLFRLRCWRPWQRC